jgi:hypothetical protein
MTLKYDPGHSIHTSRGWRGQYDRARRWLERLDGIAVKRRFTGDSLADHDFIYAFFQNCHYLREYLIAFGAVTVDELDALYNGSVELRFCRDICNATKHVEISRAPAESSFVSFFREYDHFHIPGPLDDPYAAHQTNVRVGDAKMDVYELARRCMTTWDTFLRTKELL